MLLRSIRWMLWTRTISTARRLSGWYQKLRANTPREYQLAELKMGILTRSTGDMHHTLELLEAIFAHKFANHVQVGLESTVSVHGDGTQAQEYGGASAISSRRRS